MEPKLEDPSGVGWGSGQTHLNEKTKSQSGCFAIPSLLLGGEKAPAWGPSKWRKYHHPVLAGGLSRNKKNKSLCSFRIAGFGWVRAKAQKK
jgi:hypothetical protein